jgi:hypothetical protein
MADEASLTAKYEFRDYLQAHRLHDRSRRIVLRSGILLVGAVCLLVGLGHATQGRVVFIVFGLLFVAWGLFLSDLRYKQRVRKMWNNYPGMRNASLEMVISEQSISHRIGGSAKVVHPWENFIRWKEGDAVFLLYMSLKTWLIVPKRLLTEDQISRLRKLLANHVRSPSEQAAGQT